MDRQEIRAAKKIVAAGMLDAGLFACFRSEVLTPGDDVHFEGPTDFGHARAELAETKKRKRHAFEIESDRGLPGGPGLEPGVLVADVAREFEHQTGGDGGGGIAEGGRTADH